MISQLQLETVYYLCNFIEVDIVTIIRWSLMMRKPRSLFKNSFLDDHGLEVLRKHYAISDVIKKLLITCGRTQNWRIVAIANSTEKQCRRENLFKFWKLFVLESLL